MNIIYNTQEDIASKIKDFLLKVDPTIRKTQLKIIPYIIIGMILSESSVKLDIAKKLKHNFSLVQIPSVTKRIYRFFKNKLFNPYDFYDKIIRFVISSYKKKHSYDNRVHITFDHMFSHNNFTVFMISMRIGTQGIPLWFRCFKGHDDYHAFQEQLLKDGISYVSSLFDKSFDLIFLADRWFNSSTLMEHINSLGHTFCIRLKSDVKVLAFDKKKVTKFGLLLEIFLLTNTILISSIMLKLLAINIILILLLAKKMVLKNLGLLLLMLIQDVLLKIMVIVLAVLNFYSKIKNQMASIWKMFAMLLLNILPLYILYFLLLPFFLLF